MKAKVGRNRSSPLMLITTLLILSLVLPAYAGEVEKVFQSRDGAVNSQKGGEARADYVEGEILIRFKPEHQLSRGQASDAAGKAAFAAEAAKSGVTAELKKSLSQISVHHARITDGMAVEEAVRRLQANPNVVYAEPNYLRHVDMIPNDTRFNQLWGLHNTGQTGGTADADIDAPEAWDTTMGSSGVVVAVLDTGVDYTHEDLIVSMWANEGEVPGDGIDNDGNGYVDDVHGINAITGSGDPLDDHSHGTHVAGTIAAQGNNNKGVIGVSPNVKIMALKFIDAYGFGTVLDEVGGMLYVHFMKSSGVNVVAVNASFGGGSLSRTERDAIRLLRGDNILFAAAAGNGGSDNGTVPFYPSNYDLDNIIAVAATDHNDSLATFSNFGATTVDVAAPGVDIWSSVPNALAPYVFVSPPVNQFFEDMEGGAGNWTAQAPWAITTEFNTTPGGTSSFSDSPGTTYANDTNINLDSRAIDLSGVGSGDVCLGYSARIDLEFSFDVLWIYFSSDDGATWNQQFGWTGHGTVTGDIALIPPSFRTADFKVRFNLVTDFSVVYDGVNIDDVRVGACANEPYDSFRGTSMATPHVTGIAALLASRKPALTYSQVRNVIVATVDPIPSLAGMMVSGGRVNAWNAISAVSDDAAIVVNPIPHNFGDIHIGSMSGKVINISNLGGDDLAISGISVTGNDSSLFSVSTQGTDACPSLSPALPPLAHCTVVVRFSPNTAGPKSASLVIASNDPVHPVVDVRLTGNGTISSPFNDVPEGSFAEHYISTIFYNGITSGCGGGNFCPDASVTRAQMAVFLEKGMRGSDFVPPSATGIFSDVAVSPVKYWAADWIEQLYHGGITSGCSVTPLAYCPEVEVSRGQMSVFISKALDEAPAAACTGSVFNDVNMSTVSEGFCRYIEKFAELGITSGCQADDPSTPDINEARYCPDLSVTRAQMAVFLTKAFLQ